MFNQTFLESLCITFIAADWFRYFRVMTNRVTFNSLIGLAIIFSLLAVAPSPSFAGCRNSGGSSGSSKFGSQVNGGSVTICASAVAVTPARKTVVKSPVKVVAKSPSKPVSKPVVKSAAKPISKSTAQFRKTAKAIALPKPVIKKKVTTRVVSKPATANKTSAAADFTPSGVNGNVYPSNELTVGQQGSFTSTAVQHYRTGNLLNLPTDVRFTPISVSWNFGDGASAIGSYVPHAFSEAGVHQVQVLVVYAVSYRVKGSALWIAEPESITVADDLVVEVSAGETTSQPAVEPTAGNRVLLVGQNCLRNPGSFGCN